jgi:nicotinamide-nucleotide amidase
VVVSVISIGNELLNGDTLNTNLVYLGQRLADAGIPLQREFCVPDEPAAIRAALHDARAHSEVVITIGGLGPTSDDLTRAVVAADLGLELREDPRVAAAIRAYLARRGVTVPTEAVRLQALVPRSAEVLDNPNGTAPGLWCELPGPALVVMLPGPPSEFCPMVDAAFLPRLLRRQPATQARSRVVRVAGLGESHVEARDVQTLSGLAGIEVAYCARPGCVTVRLSAPQHPEALDAAEERLRTAFADLALPAACQTPAEHVAILLRGRGLTLATAESCTGGLIASVATDIPGSSDWFAGAVVAYANAWKENLLGVRPQTLAEHGAVSVPVVREMLAGLHERFHVAAAIAVSGIAGPAGGTPQKPVGTVVLGISVPGSVELANLSFPGNRRSVRERAAATAFVRLRQALLDHSQEPGP